MRSNPPFRFAGLAVRLVLAGVGLFCFAGVGSATPIADLTVDFTAVTFPTGWQYLHNTGTIGNSAGYAALLWDAGNARYDITGSVFPGPGPDFDFISSGGHMHPGRGTAQGAALNEYLIAAYTIQAGEAGFVSLINGSLSGADPNGASGASNGWDIRAFVGNTQVGSTVVVPWSLSAASFSQPLGALNVGDTIYLAVGPNGSHLFDSAVLEFQLDSSPNAVAAVPEPASLLLMGSGLVGAGVRRWRKRR